VDAIVQREPASLANAPAALAKIVSQALAKEPQHRFASPDAFARALGAFLASSGTPSTTQELADFLRGLSLPKLPLEVAEQDTVIRARLPGSFSLKSAPSLDSARGWQPEGAGPRSEPPWKPEEIATLQEDWRPEGPQLDASGHMHVVQPARKERAAPAPAPSEELQPLAQVKVLELARPLRDDETRAGEGDPSESSLPAPPPSPRMRRGAGGWLAAAVLAGIVAAAVVKGPELYDLLSQRLRALAPLGSSPAAPLLSIESEPSGAKIQIGTQVVGETPLFIENLYPRREIEVKLSMKGYYAWTGRFAGGQPATVRATLRRR
jgi:serine/threonine-protein kinase